MSAGQQRPAVPPMPRDVPAEVPLESAGLPGIGRAVWLVELVEPGGASVWEVRDVLPRTNKGQPRAFGYLGTTTRGAVTTARYGHGRGVVVAHTGDGRAVVRLVDTERARAYDGGEL